MSIGPTGTGKTETTLYMAKILGNLCKIMNCSDGLDHQTFSQFLNGICQSKIWGLFTKFNRISLKTLSVISTLLHSTKWALIENKNGSNVTLLIWYFFYLCYHLSNRLINNFISVSCVRYEYKSKSRYIYHDQYRRN